MTKAQVCYELAVELEHQCHFPQLGQFSLLTERAITNKEAPEQN